MKPEKYEAPEVEFVEMEEEDVVTASPCQCDNVAYGDNVRGNCGSDW